jgi:anti-sigma B factor antagonist
MSPDSAARDKLLKVRSVSGATVARLLVFSILQEPEMKRLVDQLNALCAGDGPTRLVLDLSRLCQMSSGLLSKLVSLHLRLEKSGGRLALCGISPDIWEVFEITQLADRFHVYETPAEALASFGPARR